jgi:hypothetical protein
MAAGFAACLCLGLVMTFADGTTIAGLVSGLVTSPALFARSYHNAYTNPFSKWSLLVCGIGLVTAVGFHRTRSWLVARPHWLGLVKLVVGSGLLGAFILQHRTALTGSLLFLWLLIVDVRPADSNRLLLAFLSALFSLQWFPMAGDQVEWAALLPMTAAVVLLADGINLLAAGNKSRVWGEFAPAAVQTVLIAGVFLFAGLRTGTVVRDWSRGWPVNLPGAHLLRLPANDARRFTAAVTQLSRNCRTVLTLPGLYSFSIWSGVPPVEDKRINGWPFLWPEEVEKEALPKVRGTAQGCVLVDRKEYEFFKSLAVLKGHDELLTEIQRTMVPIYSVQDLTLYRSPEGTRGFVRGAGQQ